jgi:outer membrane biosynthesis protein TonB
MIVLAVVLLGNWGGDSYQNDKQVAQNNANDNNNTIDDIDLRPMTSSDIPRRDNRPAEEPAPADNSTPPSEMEQATPEPSPPPSEPTEPEPMQPEPEPAETQPPAMTPEPAPAEPPPPAPEPMPATPAPVAMTPPTNAEIAQLSKLMTTARNALTDQNIAEAKQAAQQARQLAKAPAHVAKAERLQMLVTLVSEFWRAVDESLKGIEGGDVITIATTQVAVVEVTPDLLIIRVAGRNKRYPRSDMSEGLAMGLADSWLDQTSEVTPLVRGAFYAIARNQKPDEARQQFSQAAAKGADVGDLPQILTDKYDQATLKAEATKLMSADPPMTAKPSSGPLSDADKQSLSTALRAARQAMSVGRLADADAQLTIAANIAAGSEWEPVVIRTQELAKHLRGFWDAITTSMESLQEGSTITVGSTEVTVVESSAAEITYKLFDDSYTKRRTELPAGLAKSIAKISLSNDLAISNLQLGAFHAVIPKGDPAKAREVWNEAAAAGANVQQLLLTLDDDYAF